VTRKIDIKIKIMILKNRSKIKKQICDHTSDENDDDDDDAEVEAVVVMLTLQTGVELELVESLPLLEWLANNYKSFGATLEIITDKSQEGAQFVRGFGGIGGH